MANEEDFRHEDLPDTFRVLVALPKLPASMAYPESAATENARDRFRLALLVSQNYFPRASGVWERAALWLYESPDFYFWRGSFEPNTRSLNIRKNKAAKNPEHYLVDRQREINPKHRANDATWGSWVTVEDDLAVYVQKDRFEHDYLEPFHFVLSTEVHVRSYETKYIDDWTMENRPERIHPAQDNLQTHRHAVTEAIERDFFNASDLERYQRSNELNSANALNYLERETRLELFRSLAWIRLVDLIPPRQPEVCWEGTRNGITVKCQGVINLGPFARDLQQLPPELSEGNTFGESFGEWF